jgi:signal transduction histidine kinase
MNQSIDDHEPEKALSVAEGDDLDSFLDSVLEEGLRAVGTDQGSLMLLNSREAILEIIKRRGPLFDPKKRHRRFKVGEGIAGWVAQQCQAYLSPDVTREGEFKPPLGELNFRSLLVVPITRERRAIGVICADSPEVNKFSESHKETLSRLAQNVGVAIEQLAVDTFISHTKQLKQLESLHEVGRELSLLTFESQEELPRLLEEIAKDAERVLEADLVTLYQYHEQNDRFETPPTLSGKFNHPEWMIATIQHGDAPDRIVKTSETHYSMIAGTDSIMRAGEVVPAGGGLPERPSFVDREGVESSAGIPLIASQEIVGVMFVNYRSRHPFSEDEKHVIEIFAAYAALAIQGARRFREAIRARQEALQQSSRMVAHRLRNVLPVISGRIQRTLEHKMAAGDGIEWLRVALDETRRAQRIVRDFERFSRSEVFECPDLLTGAELMRKLGEIARQSLAQDGAEVEVISTPDLPILIVNLDRLSDVIANFVGDSERHKPSDLRITISGQLASESDVQIAGLKSENVYLKLIYTDNGPGIPSGSKQRIFEPFYTTRGGSGLGLAIAGHNARIHGGTLIERGQVGQGVRFELFLPATQIIKEEVTR